MGPWTFPLIGWLALAILMLALWARQRVTQNAGWVDVAWTFGLGGLAVTYGLFLDGWGPRRYLVAGLMGLWALRLGTHLWKRVSREPEDGRYAYLRRKLGTRADGWLFWFFQIQAILAVLLSLPMLLLAQSTAEGFRLWDALALVLFAISWVGEAVSDRQLHRWRSKTNARGKTCRDGLWKYSRHPNYFFEWIHWLVYPTLAIGLPSGGWLWLAPIVMYLLIRHVTGIPPTEAQSVRSRGDDYRDYQATTNAFFPGPPQVRSRHSVTSQ